MRRYLIAVLRNSDPNVPITQQAFKVSKECSPYDVTVPLNTVFFMFASADVKTAEELTNSFLAVRIGNRISLSNTIPVTYEDNSKRYWIGKVYFHNGTECIYNENTQGLVPTSCIGKNDEIIDL